MSHPKAKQFLKSFLLFHKFRVGSKDGLREPTDYEIGQLTRRLVYVYKNDPGNRDLLFQEALVETWKYNSIHWDITNKSQWKNHRNVVKNMLSQGVPPNESPIQRVIRRYRDRERGGSGYRDLPF